MKWFLVIVSVVVAHCDALTLRRRIVGGETVNITEFPYQASVQKNGKHSCGGAIISKDSILTAGHCAELAAKKLTVMIGSTIANEGKKFQVVKIIRTNPAYDDDTLKNDLAILKITPTITFSSSIKPVKLSTEKFAVGDALIVTGWGKMNDSEPNSLNYGNRPLQAVSVNVVNLDACAESYTKFDVELDDKRICAAAKGRDSCQGDSGGPLVDKKTHDLVGVISFGFECANLDFPGVYTLVAKYLDFINENM